MKIQHTLDIAAPPTRVWDITIDVEALPEHTPTMTSVTMLDPPPLTVGSTVRIKQPAQRAKVWTITELVADKRFSWTTKSRGMTMTARHDLVETKTGTQCTLTVDVDGPVAPLVGPLVRPAIRKALAVENAALKSVAERRSHEPDLSRGAVNS